MSHFISVMCVQVQADFQNTFYGVKNGCLKVYTESITEHIEKQFKKDFPIKGVDQLIFTKHSLNKRLWFHTETRKRFQFR